VAIRCFVFRPGEGSPNIFRFVTLPRVGDGISLPDYPSNCCVQSVDHMARGLTDKDKPTVQLHLKLVQNYRYQLPSYFPRRENLPPRWRR
jgi:hypothetical protein